MYGKMKELVGKEVGDIKGGGLYKNEGIIRRGEGGEMKVNEGEDVLNFCGKNYLGL